MEPSVSLSQALGKLFYAIAAIDKTIQPLEYETIARAIEKEIIPGYNNEGGIISEDSNEVIKSFNDLHRVKAHPFDAFKEFVSFKRSHEQEFTPEIKKWIWEIADRISYSFCDKNKSEVIMLSKLKSLLLE